MGHCWPSREESDLEENLTVSFMKDHLVDMAWSGVQIEGVGATFAQTKAVVEDAGALG